MIDEGVQTILEAVRARGADGDYRDLGMIRTSRLGALLIFNYTQQAQYSRSWKPVERAARGLIIDAVKGEVVALPWPKFFNLGETPETTQEALQGKPFEATVKMDGSLGIIYYAPDGWAVATRGSFEGDQARWATAYLRKHHVARLGGLSQRGTTLLVEIIYPENRVVLDYGRDERLVLIGIRFFVPSTGELTYDAGHAYIAAMGKGLGIPVVEPAGNVLADLLEGQTSAQGIEGWVLRFNDGLRVKVKTRQYLELHRAIFGLTPERIREALLAGTFHEIEQALPEELVPGARATAAAIIAASADHEARVRYLFASIQEAVGQDAPRGDFARYVVANYPNERSLLFMLLDKRPIAAAILKSLDLQAVLGEMGSPVENRESEVRG